MMSGARRGTSRRSAMMRFWPSDWPASSGKHSSPPASATSSDTQPIPVISGSSHSSKYTRGRLREACGALAHLHRGPPRSCSTSAAALRLAADHAAERAHHAQDLGDAAVVEDVHLDAGADELGGDVGLQVGEAEHQVRAAARRSCRSSRW